MPDALASAELDGDGIPDFAVVVPSGFVVVLSNGSGGSRVEKFNHHNSNHHSSYCGDHGG
jgi:hypothetical protein